MTRSDDRRAFRPGGPNRPARMQGAAAASARLRIEAAHKRLFLAPATRGDAGLRQGREGKARGAVPSMPRAASPPAKEGKA